MIRESHIAGGRRKIVSLKAVDAAIPLLARAPIVTRLLVEGTLRTFWGEEGSEGGDEALATAGHLIESCAALRDEREIRLNPMRVLLQDHSGVPVLADFATLRNDLAGEGIDPALATPRLPVELVVDHSVEAFAHGSADALEQNLDREFRLNSERYRFLKWAEQAIEPLRVVPPGNGIVHHVHLESLARVVGIDRTGFLAPDLVLGTDSHTPMVNGIGVLGWGVGGIEATTAMLGEPVSLLSPHVVGVRFIGSLQPRVTATDLAIEMTAFLRDAGVVGAFVEFFGAVGELPIAHRTTLANMAPEYGCSVAYFPFDSQTMAYLQGTGRDPTQLAVTAAYLRDQGLFGDGNQPDPELFARVASFDLSSVRPVVAAPHHPRNRTLLRDVPEAAVQLLQAKATDRDEVCVEDGSVALAAITSCTNTANPESMVIAGLIAKRAVELGLSVPATVKTVLAPGSLSVSDYLEKTELLKPLERLGFHLAGYGCMTCIGNSGPLLPEVEDAVKRGAQVFAVLSGNRNFEGRVHPSVAGAYLASPALVVAYALAGTMLIDLDSSPLGIDSAGEPVKLDDLWPSEQTIRRYLTLAGSTAAGLTTGEVAHNLWSEIDSPTGLLYDWPAGSSYLVPSRFFSHDTATPLASLTDARALVLAGDAVTTDHISPAGSIGPESLAGAFLLAHGISVTDFNSFGCRRGNHEILERGTFANPRFQNRLGQGRRGGFTTHVPSGELMSIYDAAVRYRGEGTPLIVVAGADYGTGSSRDWAAKGPALLGVRAVLAGSFERIHRSNLISVGILPLQFQDADTAESLGLTGEESFSIEGLDETAVPRGESAVTAVSADGTSKTWVMRLRADTATELAHLRAGGSLRALAEKLRGTAVASARVGFRRDSLGSSAN